MDMNRMFDCLDEANTITRILTDDAKELDAAAPLATLGLALDQYRVNVGITADEMADMLRNLADNMVKIESIMPMEESVMA